MKSTGYNFDTCPDRNGYGSLKWDKYKDRDILPLWVADMDFITAPEIITALQQRLDHGVFGYTIPHEAPVRAVLDYLKRQHGYEAKANWLNFLPGLVPAINLYRKLGFSEVAIDSTGYDRVDIQMELAL